MYRNSFFKQILLGLFVAFFFASCDKDFNEIGTNIIGDDHFGFDSYTDGSIKAFNQKLGPVASSNLDINPLGIYNNPAFGKTVASFVTQLEMDEPNPTFTTIDNAPVIDSVIMNVPYFSTSKTVAGVKTYELDSIFGENLAKIKLGIYESGYYLRDLDPSEQLGTQQVFYTDKNAEIDSYKIGQKLNNSILTDSQNNLLENDQFYFNPKEVREDTFDADGVLKPPTKSVPAMRLHLDTAFFTTKILNAPSGQLFNDNVFKNYMRGLYFKVENSGSNPQNMAMINFKKGTIKIYYKQDTQIEDNPATTDVNEEEVVRLAKTFVLKMTGNTVSLLDNSNENANYLNFINNPDTTLGDERLYLKGGEGSIAVIDIFGTTDLVGLTRNTNFDTSKPASLTNPKFTLHPNYDFRQPISPDNPKYLNTGPNGISDEIDNMNFNDWLINEANLTFYVDKTQMGNAIEPERIFLFDLTNKKALIDYAFDNTTNTIKPKRNKTTFGGIIEKVTELAGGIEVERTKYKVRITNHVRNLIMKDSANVRLGLSVTESINNVDMVKLKTPNTATNKAPKMSVLSPQGTILYGTKSSTSFPTIDLNNKENRLKLEIYYTKPD